jgi:hypothetical protein
MDDATNPTRNTKLVPQMISPTDIAEQALSQTLVNGGTKRQHGQQRISYKAALTAGRLAHTRNQNEMKCVIEASHPSLGCDAASTLAMYLHHVRHDTSFSQVQKQGIFNTIRLYACLGLYGREMDENEEWRMLKQTMRHVGVANDITPPTQDPDAGPNERSF